MKHTLNIFIFLISSTACIHAQQYGFRQYHLKDGLPQSQIGRIAEDPFGRIWLGTYYGGVSCFDGQAFKNYGFEEGMLEEEVVYLTTSKRGVTYVLTSSGITTFQGVSIDTYSLPPNLMPPLSSASHAADVVQDTLWFGTLTDGVYFWTPDSLGKVSLPAGGEGARTTAITRGDRGDLWLGTERGEIFTRQGGSFILKGKLPVEATVYSLTPDGYERWWLATSQGVYLYQYGKVTAWLPSMGLPEGAEVYRIALDKEGGIWLASSIGGVFLYERGELYHFGEAEGLTDYEVLDVYADRSGNVWVATDGAGLFRFGGRQFSYLTIMNGLGAETAYSMVEVGPEQYWLVTDAPGVQWLDQGKVVSFGESSGLPSNISYVVRKMHDGSVWVGTQNGAARWNGQGFDAIPFPARSSAKSRSISEILKDQEGTLWLSGRGYLSSWDGSQLKQWPIPDSMVYTDIVTDCMHLLSDGRLLLGISKRLLVFDPRQETFSYFLPEVPVLHEYYTVAVHEGDEGDLWFALLNYGLVHISGDSVTVFNEQDGLTSNQLYLMHWDSRGQVWLGSEKGVDRLRLLAGLDSVTVTHFGVREGFKGQEVHAHAVMEASDSRIWFGTVEGVMIYNPRFDRPVLEPPFLYFKDLQVFFEHRDWSGEGQSLDSLSGLPENLTLRYRENHLTFSFAAVDLKQPEKVQYRHRLLPDQEEWSPSMTDGKVVFSSLPPGSYEFQVQAANHSGIWTPQPLSYSFTITPPLWRQSWFIGVSILLSFLGLYFLYQARVSRLKKARRLLALRVEERTQELYHKNQKLKETGAELQVALNELATQNKAITQSILYARRIQEAVLPSLNLLDQHLPESFLLFQPKEIVSGDFFWYTHREGYCVAAVADCTGHGVPGAFMSMIGNTALNQIVRENNILDPGEILNRLRRHIVTSLQLDADGFRRMDGMDVAVISYHHDSNTLLFAGAKRPLYQVKGNLIFRHKGSSETIGYVGDIPSTGYTSATISWEPGDMLYLTTDGFADQFGGPKGKKMMVKRLKKELQSAATLSMAAQKEHLLWSLKQWMGDEPQTDDVLLVGIRHPKS